jgi:hypothetical protein
MMPAKSHRFKFDAFVETWGEWKIAMDGDSDSPVFSFSVHVPPIVTAAAQRSGKRKPLIRRDAFEIKDKFLKIRTSEDALDLFQWAGPWRLNDYLGNEAAKVTFSQIETQRKYYREALLMEIGTDGSIRSALKELDLFRELDLKMPFGAPGRVFAVCRDVEQAVRAALFLEKSDGLPWRPCAREDCLLPFKVEGDKRKRFHSPECAHIQASRDWKKRKREERVKREKTNGNL